MLNKLEKSQIKELMRSPGWDALMIFAGKIIDKWTKEEVKADTEFETLWRMATQKGKIEGLKEYFDNLDSEVSSE